jgi:hypothetical protein
MILEEQLLGLCVMADDSAEHRDASLGGSGESGHERGRDETSRAASRRRIIVASLLTPPAVLTLGSPAARAVNTLNHDTSSVSQSAMKSTGTLR